MNKSILSIITVFALMHNTLMAKEAKTLADIEVTAQKQEESIFEVPLSLNVFTQFDIEDKNIKSIKDIGKYTPNLYMVNPGDFGAISPSSRGLYSDASSVSTTVGMYIDGIPTLGTVGYNAILQNIERIEVLRGPQGTLYGKNAQAGVINVITKQPTNIFSGSVNASFGSDNKKEYSVNVNGPIVENKLFFNLSARHYSKDGFISNSYLNNKENYRENNYGKISLLYKASDNLKLSLISSKAKYNDGAPSMNSMNAVDSRKTANNIQGFNKSQNTSHAFKLEYLYDDYKFESISAYKKDLDYRLGDYDFSSMTFYHSTIKDTYKSKSQEFRLSNNIGDFNYLLGLYLDKDNKIGGYEIDSANPAFKGKFSSTLDNNSLGIFLHTDYKINDALTLISGVRYDKDNKKISDKTQNIDLSTSYSEISPKLSLKYKINNNQMTYVSIAKGYKSGGFYMFAAPGNPKNFDKETLWNYELGIKNKFLEDTLSLNLTAYYMDIKDMQVLTSTSAVSGYISNAASSSSKGLELELQYQLNDFVNVYGTLGYNKTNFKDFSDTLGNYSGNFNPYAPKYSYSAGIKYRGASGYYTSADINGYGKMYLDKANKFEQKAYSLVSTKIGYEAEEFDIYLYANNLFNKQHDTNGYYEGKYVLFSDPREIGIQLTYRF